MTDLELETSYIEAYAKLGISRQRCTQLMAEANHVLQIMSDGSKATIQDIDAAVVRLAKSSYFAASEIKPTVSAALKGGVFSSKTEFFSLKTSLIKPLLHMIFAVPWRLQAHF